jgi:hypothetical protein
MRADKDAAQGEGKASEVFYPEFLNEDLFAVPEGGKVQREVSGKSKVGTLSIEPAIGKGSNLWYFCGKQRVEKVIRVPCNQRVGESFAREPVG